MARRTLAIPTSRTSREPGARAIDPLRTAALRLAPGRLGEALAEEALAGSPPAPALGTAPAVEASRCDEHQPSQAPKRRGQGRGPNAAAGPGGGQAAHGIAPEAVTTGTGQSSKGRPGAHSGGRKAAAGEPQKRRSQKTSSEGAAARRTCSQRRRPQAQTGKSKHEREREREQRRRERKAEKEALQRNEEGTRSTGSPGRREREEPAHQPAPARRGRSRLLAPTTPRCTPRALRRRPRPVPLPKIVSERAAGSRAHTQLLARQGSTARHGAAALPVAPGAVAAPLATAPASAAADAARHATPAAHQAAKASGPGAQLVTTVTRIIGVVPPLLWLLVGVLGLLAIAFAVSSRLSARQGAAAWPASARRCSRTSG